MESARPLEKVLTRHNHIIARLRINIFRILVAGGRKSHGSLRDQKSLIVHFVPMRRGARNVGWDDEFDGAETVV